MNEKSVAGNTKREEGGMERSGYRMKLTPTGYICISPVLE
jgi:hypothetical protein